MKKTLVALAAFSAVSAFAQSTVTISGIINYGMKRAETGAQTFGGLKGDRNNIGFDVAEDMGGGTSAIAKLQIRFNSANGSAGYTNTAASTETAAGTTLMEQTMVGLTSNSLGTVKVGRFTNDIGTYDVSVFEDSGYGTNASNAMYGRLSGTIQYTSPTISGITVSLINADAQANIWGNAGGATGGGLTSGINYSTYSSTGFNNFGAIAVKYEMGPWLAQVASIGGLYGDKNTRVGVRYTMNNGAKLYYGSYKQSGTVGGNISTNATATYTMPVATSTGYGWASHTNTELGASLPVGPVTLRAGYVMSNNDLDISKTDGTSKVSKFSLGAEYNLSKRTMLMAQAGKTSNSTANVAAGGAIFTQGTAYWTGIQHSF